MSLLPRLTSDDLERFEKYVQPVTESGCWLWMGGGGRYGHFHTSRCRSIGRKYEQAHRVSYELFKGTAPSNQVIRHTCDVSLCVNPDHLLEGSIRDNVLDCVKRGRHRSGRKRITPDSLEEMRSLRRSGMQVKEIASLFNLSPSHASRLVKGCQPKWSQKCLN